MVENAKYTNASASALIKTGPGTLYGIIVNSHTGGRLTLWDNTSGATTVILNTITFAAGPQTIMIPMGVSFYTGLYVTVGGTIDYTILSF